MVINQSNIRNFIAYIYFNKYQTKPTEEILSSWGDMDDGEIQIHLNGLYQSWGKDTIDLEHDIIAFEQAYHRHKSLQQTDESNAVSKTYNKSVLPNSYEKTTQNSGNYNPQQHTEQVAYTPKKSNRWLWYLTIPVLAISGFMGYKYMQYNNLKPLYAITDNIVARDITGANKKRMDIFPTEESFNSLRAVDASIYEIPVNGKVSESRKLLLDDANFWDYLTNNDSMIVYVNKDFVTENHDYIALNTSVFKDINKIRFENNNLTSSYRKVIVGSVSLDHSLRDKHIINTCNNNAKDFQSILKVTLKDKKRYTAVAKMSDGNFYKFTGNPEENTFEKPQKLKVQHPDEDGFIDLYGKDLLFKEIEGNVYLFNCEKDQLDFKMVKTNEGDLSHFQSTYLPS